MMAADLAPAPRLRLADLLRPDADGGALALLTGQRAVTTYAARVAIRAGCDLLGLRPGDEVLVPAYNCGSEVDALLDAGLLVVMYPVGQDAVVRAQAVEAAVTPATRAVYLTHYFGLPQPEGDAIRALCDRLGLALMEDCALSLLSGTGRLGDVAFHCFYKVFPVNAGGALVVNRADLALPVMDRRPPALPALKFLGRALIAGILGARGIGALKAARRWLRRGRAGPAMTPDGAPQDMPGDYYFDRRLARTRMSWLAHRPLGGVNVARAVAARRRNFEVYQRLLAGNPEAAPLIAALPAGACPLNMPILVQERDRLARELAALGVAVVPWWAGYHRKLDYAPFAEARHLKDHVLALPLHQDLSVRQIEDVVAALKAVL